MHKIFFIFFYKRTLTIKKAGIYKIKDTRFDIFAVFHEGHVPHVVEEQYLGMTWNHGLREGYLYGNTAVVLAIDEEDRHIEMLEDMDARGTFHHAALGSDDRLRTGLKALVLQVFDFVREGGTVAVVEKRGNKVDNKGSAVLHHLVANCLAGSTMLLTVGQSMGVDESQPSERIGVLVGKGHGDIAAHGMTRHNALVDATFVEYSLDDSRHEIHGMLVAEALAQSMTRQVDGDYPQMMHVAQYIRAPYVEVLQETMKEYQCFPVVTALVTIVDEMAVEH